MADFEICDIETAIQYWFSQCTNYQDITELYFRIKSETNAQVDYMGLEIAKRMAEECELK